MGDRTAGSPGGSTADEPERRLRVPWIVGGAILGFVLSWFVFAVTIFALYAAVGDSSATAQNVLAAVGLFGLPVVLGALLVPRRTRQLGAGLLLGLAVGAITGAGVCAGFLRFGG